MIFDHDIDRSPQELTLILLAILYIAIANEIKKSRLIK